jgi:hypothetical protein
MTPDVVKVIPHEDYILEILFDDDSRKLYDVKALGFKGVFAKLLNVVYFKQATVENGTVSWNSTLDIAPEELYTNGVAL